MSDNNKARLIHAKAALEEAQRALELALRDEPGDDSITFRARRERAEIAELNSDKLLKRKICVTRRVRRRDLKVEDVIIYESQAYRVTSEPVIHGGTLVTVEYGIHDGRTVEYPNTWEDVLVINADGNDDSKSEFIDYGIIFP